MLENLQEKIENATMVGGKPTYRYYVLKSLADKKKHSVADILRFAKGDGMKTSATPDTSRRKIREVLQKVAVKDSNNLWVIKDEFVYLVEPTSPRYVIDMSTVSYTGPRTTGYSDAQVSTFTPNPGVITSSPANEYKRATIHYDAKFIHVLSNCILQSLKDKDIPPGMTSDELISFTKAVGISELITNEELTIIVDLMLGKIPAKFDEFSPIAHAAIAKYENIPQETKTICSLCEDV